MPAAARAPSLDELLSPIQEGEKRALAEAVLLRSVPLLGRMVAGASADALLTALSAPTDVGTLARLISVTGGADERVEDVDPLADAFARGAEIKRELLAEAGGGWPVSRVADHLGITRQATDKRRRRSRLLAVDWGGEYLYPALQFAADGVVPHFPAVLGAFQVANPWTRLSVLLSETPRLPGRTVIEALREGHLEEALHAVRTFGEQGAL